MLITLTTPPTLKDMDADILNLTSSYIVWYRCLFPWPYIVIWMLIFLTTLPYIVWSDAYFPDLSSLHCVIQMLISLTPFLILCEMDAYFPDNPSLHCVIWMLIFLTTLPHIVCDTDAYFPDLSSLHCVIRMIISLTSPPYIVWYGCWLSSQLYCLSVHALKWNICYLLSTSRTIKMYFWLVIS